MEMRNGYVAINNMVAMWATEPLDVFTTSRTVKALAANTTSYTVGSGGSINIARPLWITKANLIIDNTQSTVTERQLTIFTVQDWAGIAQKTLASTQSLGVYYDNDWSAGLSKVWPWPVPNV